MRRRIFIDRLEKPNNPCESSCSRWSTIFRVTLPLGRLALDLAARSFERVKPNLIQRHQSDCGDGVDQRTFDAELSSRLAADRFYH